MSAAFKEWAVVCEALGGGLQSVIVRKGGIAEGREGFAFREVEFFLFPTWFHEQIERTRLPKETALPAEPAEVVEIRYAVNVEWSGLVTDWQRVLDLEELHVLAPSVVEERFHYDQQDGVHIAFVRVYRLDPPQRLPLEKRFGGCRSWVELPELDACALVSVLSDEEHARRRLLLQKVVGLSGF